VAPGIELVVTRTLSTGRAVRWYETHSRATPEVRVLGVRSTPLERDDRPWVTLVLQDITAGKRVEALNRRAERLEAVAELAASLAHEIKNPLASIRSAVEQLTRSQRTLAAADRDRLGELVLGESDRLSRLLSGFIEFSRVEIQERTSVDLLEVAGEAVGVVRQHPDAEHTTIELSGRSVTVDGDADLLHRVVFNLILNAVQHSPSGSPVTVEVDAVPERPSPSAGRLTGGGRIRVADRGPGIADEDVPRLFDPFFTTRPGGSGLGLALVHRAVEAHQGVILVDDNGGAGTLFTVLLPPRPSP
jgi:signal transduction histidine kinase